MIALAKALLEPGPIPVKAATDATHIAVATVMGADYLLTWNFKHLANAALRKRINAICRTEGFDPPVICTPEDLLMNDADTVYRDEIIEEVRARKEALAAAHDYDIDRLFETLRKRQSASDRPTLEPRPRRIPEGKAA
ncbi:MAG: hypothetical protein AAF730_08115 [Bacteroidota bacterium]